MEHLVWRGDAMAALSFLYSSYTYFVNFPRLTMRRDNAEQRLLLGELKKHPRFTRKKDLPSVCWINPR